jgi:signal peptidase
MNSQARGKAMLGNVGLKLLSEGKTIKIRAHGYSMYPCIKPGTIVLIEPLILKGKPVKGEIVAIRRDSGLVVHRLTGITRKNGKEFYVTRGDSNIMPDDPVKAELIAGRVTGTEINGIRGKLPINTKPAYILNRFRVNWIILWNKACRLASIKQSSR